MTKAWTPVRVGDVADVIGGGTPPTSDPANFGDEVPWLTPKDLALAGPRYVLRGQRGLTKLGLEQSSARLLPPGAVLLSTRAPIGYVAIAAGPISTNQGFRSLVLQKGQVPDYWYYLLKHARPVLEAHANGTTFKELAGSALANLWFRVPGETEQRAIAEVLGALDDKIDANGRLIAAVRQLLAALYQQVASSAGGAGWRTSMLGEELDVLETGRRPPGGIACYTSGVPSIGAESVTALAAFDYSKTKFVPVEFFEQMKRGVVEDLDILLYKDGGRPGEFEPHVSLLGNGFPFPQFCINEHVYRLRVRPPLTQEYLYCWLSSEPVLEEMRRRGTGVAVPGLNSSAVKGLPMVVPPADVLETFSERAAPLARLALSRARESRILARLRDTLLPPLVSGRLRVKEAESLVGEAE